MAIGVKRSARIALTTAEREALRETRDRYKLKRIALAIGVGYREVQAWERGERRPTQDQHQRWIRALAAPD